MRARRRCRLPLLVRNRRQPVRAAAAGPDRGNRSLRHLRRLASLSARGERQQPTCRGGPLSRPRQGRRFRSGGRVGSLHGTRRAECAASKQPARHLRIADGLGIEPLAERARARRRDISRRDRPSRRADRRGQFCRAVIARYGPGLSGRSRGQRAGIAAAVRQLLQAGMGLRHFPLPGARLRIGLSRGQSFADRQSRPCRPRRCLSSQGDALFYRRGDGLCQGRTLQPYRRARFLHRQPERRPERPRCADLGPFRRLAQPARRFWQHIVALREAGRDL